MPLDALSTFYGDDCLKCRQEPRLENQRWGEQCLAASRLWREQYVAAVAKEDYTYIPYRVRHQTLPPPQPEPGAPPTNVCQHCGANAGWTERDGQFQCSICGGQA